MSADKEKNKASISLAITGSGGAGVMTAGNLLLEVAAQAGWYGLMVRSSGPQIRGGEAAALLRFAHAPVECLEEGAANTLCQRGDACAMRDVWREVRESVMTVLRRATLQSLSERRRTALTFSI